MSSELPANLAWEAKNGYPSALLVGVDEVGRGCLAGPVVAVAFALPSRIDFSTDPWLRQVTDSKCVRPVARERLAEKLEHWALAWGLGSASVEEIDAINIYHASHLAMCRAVQVLDEQLRIRNAGIISHILIDGNVIPKGLGFPATAVIKGDLHCLSVAAASIMAKVWRDRQMGELDQAYPGYGFAKHKGYSTSAHVTALQSLGVCGIHRRSFGPVAGIAGRPGL